MTPAPATDAIRAVYAFGDDEGHLAFNRNASDATLAAFPRALAGLKQETAAVNMTAFDRILEPSFPPAGPTCAQPVRVSSFRTVRPA